MIRTGRIYQEGKAWDIGSDRGVFHIQTTKEGCIREIYRGIKQKPDDTYYITVEEADLGPVKEYAVEGFDYNFRYNGGCLSFPADNACGRTVQEALEDLYVRVASQERGNMVMDRFSLTVETKSHRFSMSRKPIKETNG